MVATFVRYSVANIAYVDDMAEASGMSRTAVLDALLTHCRESGIRVRPSAARAEVVSAEPEAEAS